MSLVPADVAYADLPRDAVDLLDRVAQRAIDLLGARLTVDREGERVTLRITEVEAYGGGYDPGSHAFRGRTARNAAMFGPPLHAYVYRHMGLHTCFNVVVGVDGTPTGVLLRAGEIVEGVDVARDRRRAKGRTRRLRLGGWPGQADGGAWLEPRRRRVAAGRQRRDRAGPAGRATSHGRQRAEDWPRQGDRLSAAVLDRRRPDRFPLSAEAGVKVDDPLDRLADLIGPRREADPDGAVPLVGVEVGPRGERDPRVVEER